MHDATAFSEIYQTEMLGFCEPGEVDPWPNPGRRALWAHPRQHLRGLLSKGHPVAASGLSMITEIAVQLRGEAGARQVNGARGRARRERWRDSRPRRGGLCKSRSYRRRDCLYVLQNHCHIARSGLSFRDINYQQMIKPPGLTKCMTTSEASHFPADPASEPGQASLHIESSETL